jgi:hypothetical protein
MEMHDGADVRTLAVDRHVKPALLGRTEGRAVLHDVAVQIQHQGIGNRHVAHGLAGRLDNDPRLSRKTHAQIAADA